MLRDGHDGGVRRIWHSGVRARGVGRSRSSPSERELMLVPCARWPMIRDAGQIRNGGLGEQPR